MCVCVCVCVCMGGRELCTDKGNKAQGMVRGVMKDEREGGRGK